MKSKINTKKLKEFVSFSKLRNKWMKDPEFKKAYDDLEFEFQITKAIIIARAKQNLTQKQLAEKIGVTQSVLARFESGRSNPTLSFLKKITSGLGLKLVVK